MDSCGCLLWPCGRPLGARRGVAGTADCLLSNLLPAPLSPGAKAPAPLAAARTVCACARERVAAGSRLPSLRGAQRTFLVHTPFHWARPQLLGHAKVIGVFFFPLSVQRSLHHHCHGIACSWTLRFALPCGWVGAPPRKMTCSSGASLRCTSLVPATAVEVPRGRAAAGF